MKYWKYVFSLLLMITLLASCGVKETEKSVQPVPLTEAEIDQVNEAFASMREENGMLIPTEVSCFFTSYYDRAEELDFKEFIWYFPAGGKIEDGKEFAALAALPDFPWKEPFAGGRSISEENLPVPIHKIPEEAINAALTKWAGITLDDVAGKSEILYLDEYNSFYTYTSDFGPGFFTCTEGEVNGDAVQLWSEANSEGRRDLLTLEEENGNWYIRSFQKVQTDEEQL